MEKYDVFVIGAGVVGLAVTKHLTQLEKSEKKILLVEQHSSFGMETSSRNSEVIHAGIYYTPGSLKSRLCAPGNEMMYDLCRKYNIPHRVAGKLIVATTDEEASMLPTLLANAQNNEAKKVSIIDTDEITRLEPNVSAKAAILCPSTGIVDTHSLMRFLEAVSIEAGADIAYNVEVVSIEKKVNGYIVGIRDVDGSIVNIESKIVINCAGLHADKIAEMVGIDIDEAGYRHRFIKGIYFRVMRQLAMYPAMLIYPFPTPERLVGIHTTPDVGGGMRLGPHFIVTDMIEYSVDDSLHDYFFESARSYLPFLDRDDIQPDMAGVHPFVFANNKLIDDFIIRHEADRGFEGLVNLINIGSPGLTSALSIGKMVKEIVGKII